MVGHGTGAQVRAGCDATGLQGGGSNGIPDQCFLRSMIRESGPQESFGLMSQHQGSSVCMGMKSHPIHFTPFPREAGSVGL